MSYEQGRMWIRFFERFPFDPETLHFAPPASIAACIVNANGGVKGKTVSARDMLVVKPPPEKPVSMDEKWRRLFSKKQQTNKPA